MFTQCLKCETVFRLSAEALRAAGGQVRCGRCGEVFNALSRLAEDAAGFTRGESPLFLETRADGILESSSSDLPAVPLDSQSSEAGADSTHGEEPDLPSGVNVVQLQFIGLVDDDLAAETSLEFTLPPGELDRIFIETRPSPLRQLSADGYRAERGEIIPLHHDAPIAPPDAPPLHPESPPAPPQPSSAMNAPAVMVSALPSSTSPGPGQVAAPVKLPQSPAPPSGPAPPSAPPPARVAGLEVSEEVRREMLSGIRADAARESTPLPRSASPAQSRGQGSRPRLQFTAWLAAALVLGMLLVIQVVRGNTGWVAAHLPSLGSGSTANPSVYQLRQWGVTGDPGAKGTLRVRASIMNTSPQLQSYPLLQVTLVNRFGTHVGARKFEPAEYLGHGNARLLAPGERVDATLDILDPGKDAEGFEIDVCIRSAEKILCAGDAAARVK